MTDPKPKPPTVASVVEAVGLLRGRYRSRLACHARDVRAAQRLRHLAFYGTAGCDTDSFDASCDHMLIEDHTTGDLLCCFRFLRLTGATIDQSYAAQSYDLASLSGYSGTMVEMGRFCTRPGLLDADVLRLAWGAMTAYVDAAKIALLFGCASFAGTDPLRYADSLAVLRDRHLAPSCWRPGISAPEIIGYAKQGPRTPDVKQAMRRMPPLLRTYLMMGGWVSDHAVVDRRMNTLHVFTGVEIHAIPPARKRLLRAVAEGPCLPA